MAKSVACSMQLICSSLPPFLFKATAPSKFYTLSLHDALPILLARHVHHVLAVQLRLHVGAAQKGSDLLLDELGLAFLEHQHRSEEHTSELQSRGHLVCRLLLEKKKVQANEFVLESTEHAGYQP